MLESVYEEALVYERKQRGVRVERQKLVPLVYKGNRLAGELRIDLLVEDLVSVECKAAREDPALFEAQVLTYLRLLNLKLGLVINFGKRLVKDAIHRVVNGL